MGSAYALAFLSCPGFCQLTVACKLNKTSPPPVKRLVLHHSNGGQLGQEERCFCQYGPQCFCSGIGKVFERKSQRQWQSFLLSAACYQWLLLLRWRVSQWNCFFVLNFLWLFRSSQFQLSDTCWEEFGLSKLKVSWFCCCFPKPKPFQGRKWNAHSMEEKYWRFLFLS